MYCVGPFFIYPHSLRGPIQGLVLSRFRSYIEEHCILLG
jgi:hypothetical protein